MSSAPPARELKEFHEVHLFTEEGADFVEKLYGSKGLLPPLGDFLKKAEIKLNEILTPRPVVKPCVKTRRRRRENTVKTFEMIPDGAQSLPTPPYEQDPQPLPDIYRAQSVPSPVFVFSSNVCEDLEGIADLAPGTPQPPLPASPSPPTKRKRKRNSKTWRKLSAKKSTKARGKKLLKDCHVLLLDLRLISPEIACRLLEEYQSSIRCHERGASRSNSIDSGNATDEGERSSPSLQRKRTVHDGLGQVLTGPLRSTIDCCSDHDSAGDAPQEQGNVTSDGMTPSVVSAEVLHHHSPNSRPGQFILCQEECADAITAEDPLPISSQKRALENELISFKRGRLDLVTNEIPSNRPKVLPKTTATEFSSYQQDINTDPGRSQPTLVVRGSNLFSEGIHGKNLSIPKRWPLFLTTDFDIKKTDFFMSVPTDALPTLDFNCSTLNFARLNVLANRKEITLKTISPYLLDNDT